jgi:hypothetical protein
MERLIMVTMVLAMGLLFKAWFELPTQNETARNIASIIESINGENNPKVLPVSSEQYIVRK